MNWDHTPAQQRAIGFALEPPRKYGRDSNEDLIKVLVAIYRAEKRPPLESDVPRKRSTYARRFGGFAAARQLAYERLTLEEQEECKLRCPCCGRDDLKNYKGLASHVRACERKKDEKE